MMTTFSRVLQGSIKKLRNKILVFAVVSALLLVTVILAPQLNLEALRLIVNPLLIIYVVGVVAYVSISVLKEYERIAERRKPTQPPTTQEPLQRISLERLRSFSNSLYELFQDLPDQGKASKDYRDKQEKGLVRNPYNMMKFKLDDFVKSKEYETLPENFRRMLLELQEIGPTATVGQIKRKLSVLLSRLEIQSEK